MEVLDKPQEILLKNASLLKMKNSFVFRIETLSPTTTSILKRDTCQCLGKIAERKRIYDWCVSAFSGTGGMDNSVVRT